MGILKDAIRKVLTEEAQRTGRDIRFIDTPFFHFAVSRICPRTGRNIWALFMDYCPTDKKPAMLYENFESLSDIPSEYGDLTHTDMPAQPPQFVYGYFSRLGDALNSMLKGCSIDLRKPIELYY